MTAPNRFRFRAWNGHSMVYDFSIYAASGVAYDTFIADGARTEQRYPVDGKIMQSTGLLDKNGVEIFEGDILQGQSGSGPVVWDSDIAAFSWSGGEDWGMIHCPDVEVIGNIYQRPDSA